MHTLHLTKEEQKLFAKLSPDLTKDLSVEAETLSYEDTPQRRAIRLKLLKVQDSSILAFLESAKKAKDNEGFIEAVKSVDLTKMSSDDLSELFFAIGPDAIGVILHGVLLAAVSRQDLDVAVSLSTIRHGVLEAFSEATSS